VVTRTSHRVSTLATVVLPERQRVAAYGLARSGSSLLLVRGVGTGDVPPRWWLPGGGVKFGEAPKECLVRELAEETGLRVAHARLRHVASDVQPLVTESVLLHSIRLIYDVTVKPGPLIDERSGSTDSVAWFPESRLAELVLVPWLRSYLDESSA
jgi:8-oxo-dGTP diphosphatase